VLPVSWKHLKPKHYKQVTKNAIGNGAFMTETDNLYEWSEVEKQFGGW